MRLIDIDPIIEKLKNAIYLGKRIGEDTANLEAVLADIEAQPTAEKKGKWEVCDILDYAQRPSGRKILRCPFCGYLTGEFRSMVDYYHKLTHFCPNCGARMEE